jgi:undecaprenyl-diphosphatase
MISGMDRYLFQIINQGPYNAVFDSLMVFITEYRFFIFLVILIPFIIKDRNKALLILSLGTAGIIISSFSVSLLKLIFARPRPCLTLENIRLLVECHSSFSMPSGHAATSFTAASIMGHFIRPAAVPAFILAFLVAVTRIYVGVHYPFDVVAGVVWGGVIAGVIILFHNRISANEKKQ